MKSACRAAAPEPSTPLTVFDRHAAAAFQSLLDDKPLLEPLRPASRALDAAAPCRRRGLCRRRAGGRRRTLHAARPPQQRPAPAARPLLPSEEPAPKNTLADLLASPVPWRPRGRARPGARRPELLAGKPHAGKSWLSLQLALAVASGSQVMRTQRQGSLPGARRSPLAAAAPLAPARRHTQPVTALCLRLAGLRRWGLAAAGSRDGRTASAWSSSTP